MLKQRVITALVMLAILLPAVFYPKPLAFQVIASLLILAAAWEWANLNQCGPLAAYGVAAICGGGCLLAWLSGWTAIQFHYLWFGVGGAWVLGGVFLLAAGVSVWIKVPRWFRLVIGLLVLWAAWLAILQARDRGINFLISTMVLVWIADVFAYFSGRAMGGRFIKRKLAPSISPGKTWEGALGGLLGVMVGTGIWVYLDQKLSASSLSIFSELANAGWPSMFLAVTFLAAMSVVGDLVESLFKRSAGFKDSSNLLPGHGGVLDRLDALLPVMPLALMLTSL